MDRRAWRRRWALVPAMVLAGAVACAGEGGGGDGDVVTGPVAFEATADYLAAASRRSAGEPYRIEMTMTWDAQRRGDELSIEAPFMSGQLDGERYGYVVDMEELLHQMAAEEGGSVPMLDDYTIEVVGDAETLYVRAPVYAALAEARPGRDLGARGELATLGDRWGRVDLRTLDELSLARLQRLVGVSISAGELDPRILLGLVAEADDVEELGTDEVGGTPVNGLRADVPTRDLLEASGTDADDFTDLAMADGAGSGVVPAERAGIVERLLDYQMPHEVWVDGEGYVRRIRQEMDLTEVVGWGRAAAMGMEEFTIGGTVDFSAYGDESIAIELPADAVDATEMFRRALDAAEPGS